MLRRAHTFLFGLWLVLVFLCSPNQALGQAPTLSSISPTAIAPGMQVTLTGAGFGASQGNGSVQLGQQANGTVVSWSDSQIVVTVPASLVPGNAWVTKNGVNSSGIAFTVIPPTLTSISPTAIAPGMQVTLTGSGFGASQHSGLIALGSQANGIVVSWSDAQIVARVPSSLVAGNVSVKQNGVWSNGIAFTIAPSPSITSLSPSSGAVGSLVALSGTNFGATQNNSTVHFNGTLVNSITNWSATSITATVPTGATTGNVVANLGNLTSNGASFTVLPTPSITSLSLAAGAVGATVTINGANLGSTQGSGTVKFNGTAANVITWNANSIAVTVPAGATTGNVVVYASGVNSNGAGFTVVPPPVISSLSNASGAVGQSITINGSNFGTIQGSGAVTFCGIFATITSWTGTSIVALVPSGATSGSVVVLASGVSSNGTPFTVTAGPTISGLGTSSGPPGSGVVISGSNFGSIQGSVTFNGATAQVLSWSDTTIVVNVPMNATTGPVRVISAGIASNSVTFTLTSGVPTITAISETTGMVGDPLTITGSGFGTSGTISFDGVPSATSFWSDFTIVSQIPLGTQTGPVTVASGGQTSNGIVLTIAPSPLVSSISPSSGDVGTAVTINGSNFGTLLNSPVVLFNGSGVLPSSWSGTQIQATVPKGIKTGPLTVRVGLASSNPTTFTIQPAASQVLSIVPADSTLAIGQTLNLSLTDDLEHNIAGATWSITDSTVAQLSNSDPPVLTAQTAGTATITATLNGLAATTAVTILSAGVSMPVGTVACSLPTSTSSYSVQKIMQAVPSDGTTPDLVAMEDDGQGGIWLRGLSAGCEQTWHTRVGSSSSANPDWVASAIPDDLGGIVVEVSNPYAVPATSALLRIDGTTGSQAWRHDSIGLFGPLAVDQNGNTLTVETVQAVQNLVKFDGATGAPIATWALPPSTYTFVPDQCGSTVSQQSFSTSTIAGDSGPISVGPDGSYYLEVSWINEVDWLVQTPDSNFCNLSDEYYTASASTTTTQLMTVSAAGSTSLIDLPGSPTTNTNSSSVLILGPVMPDGSGGVLATALDFYQGSMRLADFGGSGATAIISNFFSNQTPDVVLGDQGTYFMSDGNKVVAADVASGNEKWRWQPSDNSSVGIIAASAGGGVVVDASSGVTQLDDNGNILGSAATLQGAVPFDLSTWVSAASGVLAALWSPDGANGIPTVLAQSPHPVPRGDTHSQNSTPFCQRTNVNCALAPYSDQQLLTRRGIVARVVKYRLFSLQNGTLTPLYGTPQIQQVKIEEKEFNSSNSAVTICNWQTNDESSRCESPNLPDDPPGQITDSMGAGVSPPFTIQQQLLVDRMGVQVFWPYSFNPQGLTQTTWYGSWGTLSAPYQQTATVTNGWAVITQNSANFNVATSCPTGCDSSSPNVGPPPQ